MNKKSPKFSKKSEVTDTSLLIVGTLIGCASVVVLLLLLTFVSSFIALRCDDPNSFTAPFAYVITAVSLLSGGIVGGRLARGRGLAAGVIIGIVCTALAFSLHLILSRKGSSGAFLFLIYPLISALGGYIGTPRQKSSSKFKGKFKK